jgi:hypothetical protein
VSTRVVRKSWVVSGVAVVAIVAIATGLVLWARDWRRAGPANPGTACPVVVRARRRLPVTAIGVHRVLLIGDSIMDQASCSIAGSLAGVGITTARHGVFGSGLLSGPVDWRTSLPALLTAERPDAVLAIFVGNLLPPRLPGIDPAATRPDTPAFFAAWQQQAEALSQQVHDHGARMYWVSPPPIATGGLSHAPRLFDGYATIAGDHVLDAGGSLAGPNDSETASKHTCGRVRVIRNPDGVHLTDDGARIYGQQVAHDLSADLGVFASPRPC